MFMLLLCNRYFEKAEVRIINDNYIYIIMYLFIVFKNFKMYCYIFLIFYKFENFNL